MKITQEISVTIEEAHQYLDALHAWEKELASVPDYNVVMSSGERELICNNDLSKFLASVHQEFSFDQSVDMILDWAVNCRNGK